MDGGQRPRICYITSAYHSHARFGGTYRSLLSGAFDIVESISEADIVVLHQEPHDYAAIYYKYPYLKEKYVIGYCVWEASELPEQYKTSINYVQEIWTCSRYCHDIFRRYHERVVRIPHVIERDMDSSEKDRALVRHCISYDPRYIYFLTITKVWDKRKNTELLVRAFRQQRRYMPEARLIVKTCPPDIAPTWVSSDDVVYVPLSFSNRQMNCLYELSDVYVSAHHSEGWGLTLADAMIFERPVIATGYSGNLDFMNDGNSFLIGFTERNIKRRDCFGLFDSGMKWAYPDQSELEEKLRLVYDTLRGQTISEKVRSASRDIMSFNSTSIKEMLLQAIYKASQGQ